MLLESFAKVISDPVYIFAIIFASLGIACALLAKKVTKLVRKTDDIKPNDKLLIGMKVAGLALILIGFLFLMIGGIAKL